MVMATRTWRDFGPDVEVTRQHMDLHPPDEGSIEVHDDGTRITEVSWTHNGERCAVSTPIVAEAPRSDPR
jgi:hypothetical protein